MVTLVILIGWGSGANYVNYNLIANSVPQKSALGHTLSKVKCSCSISGSCCEAKQKYADIKPKWSWRQLFERKL